MSDFKAVDIGVHPDTLRKLDLLVVKHFGGKISSTGFRFVGFLACCVLVLFALVAKSSICPHSNVCGNCDGQEFS
jgi:hypothetical protein